MLMNIVTYKHEKQKITHFYWISGESTFGNPMFWKKITQKLDDSMVMLTHKICICRLRKTGSLLIFPLYITFIALFFNIEHQYWTVWDVFIVFQTHMSAFPKKDMEQIWIIEQAQFKWLAPDAQGQCMDCRRCGGTILLRKYNELEWRGGSYCRCAEGVFPGNWAYHGFP